VRKSNLTCCEVNVESFQAIGEDNVVFVFRFDVMTLSSGRRASVIPHVLCECSKMI
jgi:hypothetical protein